jgi:hypothetical protein
MFFGNSKVRLGLIGVAALALAGCEFGNRNSTELTGYDIISGYYASLPQTLSFHAQIGSSAPRTQAGVVNQMPEFLKAVMGNPTMLYFDSPLDGVATLRSHDDTSVYLVTKVPDATGNFGVSTTADATVSGCRFVEEITNSGKFTQAATTSSVAGYTVRGNISLDYSANYSLIGDDVDCDAMRATFKSCYSDGVGCSATSGTVFYRPYVIQVFGPLVDAGVITEDEISSARSVGFHATYE